MARSSVRVRVAASSMTARASTARSGWEAAMARPAWAWMAMPETWWATVSWSSRASCSRSRALAWSMSRMRIFVAIADRGAERGGEQEERVSCDRLRQAHGVGDVDGDGQPEQDDAEAACGFPTGAPPEQGVGQDQRRGGAVQQGAVRPGEDSDDVDDRQRAEGDRNRDERVRASPQQGAEDRERREQQQRARRQVLAKTWRSTTSTTDQQINTATKAQSRGPRSGAFVGRGSAHSERSALVAI